MRPEMSNEKFYLRYKTLNLMPDWYGVDCSCYISLHLYTYNSNNDTPHWHCSNRIHAFPVVQSERTIFVQLRPRVSINITTNCVARDKLLLSQESWW